MQIFNKDTEKDLIFIAECGVNHEGNLSKAKELIELAKEAGADAVKFQSYTPEKYVTAQDEERFSRIGKFCFNENQFIELKNHAYKVDIPIFSTAVTEDWVSILAKHFDVIKIASGDLNFKPVIDRALKTDKKIIISVGGGTDEEIHKTLEWAEKISGINSLKNRLILMHCISAYPVPIEEANLENIKWLKNNFNLTIGYSNHVIGPLACYAAIALGANILEMHFTDKKTDRTFRDHALSFEPEDLKNFISTAYQIKSSLGNCGSFRPISERNNLISMRKGVVYSKDMKKGDIIEEADLHYARPSNSINIDTPPHEFKKSIIGKELSIDVNENFLVNLSDFKN